MLSRLIRGGIAFAFTLVVLLLLLPLLVLISACLLIADLPRIIGDSVDIESRIRRAVFTISNPNEMRRFRDDVLHIVESENKDSGSDRWSLLREMDQAKDDIETRLRRGEFAFSFAGGISALIIGNVFGIASGGIAITVIALAFSVLVSARIIVTDILCYSSIEHRNDPIERLEVMYAWNTKAALKRGAVGIAILTAFASRSKQGYKIGIGLLDAIAHTLYADDDKWQAD